MISLSLAMIVKNESDTIQRVLSMAKRFCDEMIVVDTGSIDDTIYKAASMGATVHRFVWNDNFSDARNFSFSRCTGDWIIWLDGDDVIDEKDLLGLLRLKQHGLPEDCEAVYMRYLYPPFLQWRERMVSRASFVKNLRWTGPVHECIEGIDVDKSLFREDIRITHDTPAWRLVTKTDRNIRLLRKYFECGNRDGRTLYLYAVECLHSFYREEFETIREIFFDTVKHSEYRYEILVKMSDVSIHFSENNEAVSALSRAIVEDPRRAEAYYRLGCYIMDVLDQPAEAMPLFKLAASIEIPRNGTPELKCYSYGPLEGLSRIYFRLGDVANARIYARKALRKNTSPTSFVRELAELSLKACQKSTLPMEWREWISINIERKVPRSKVIKILEHNGFSPAQIAGATL